MRIGWSVGAVVACRKLEIPNRPNCHLISGRRQPRRPLSSVWRPSSTTKAGLSSSRRSRASQICPHGACAHEPLERRPRSLIEPLGARRAPPVKRSVLYTSALSNSHSSTSAVQREQLYARVGDARCASSRVRAAASAKSATECSHSSGWEGAVRRSSPLVASRHRTAHCRLRDAELADTSDASDTHISRTERGCDDGH